MNWRRLILLGQRRQARGATGCSRPVAVVPQQAGHGVSAECAPQRAVGARLPHHEHLARDAHYRTDCTQLPEVLHFFLCYQATGRHHRLSWRFSLPMMTSQAPLSVLRTAELNASSRKKRQRVVNMNRPDALRQIPKITIIYDRARPCVAESTPGQRCGS
jgi:hypothetical protein